MSHPVVTADLPEGVTVRRVALVAKMTEDGAVAATVTMPLEPCADLLIHSGHTWETSVQPDRDGDPNWWAHVDVWCEGSDDQDDPLFRFECCTHCAAARCPTRDGHPDACAEGCPAGSTMLGEPDPILALSRAGATT